MIVDKSKYLFVILNLMLICLVGCRTRSPFSYDFEEEAVLDTLSWSCKTIFTLSDKHATSGQTCLKLELYPYNYAGIVMDVYKFNTDWSKNNILKFDIYNPGKTSLLMTIRIDDANNPLYSIGVDNPNSSIYKNRYNNSITLDPGMNQISIPLSSLYTSGTKRTIDLTNVQTMALFLSSIKEKSVLYLDNIQLE